MSFEYQVVTLETIESRLDVLAAGNLGLLTEPDRRSFLSSRKITGAAFLHSVQWAEKFPVRKAVLVTGYHSPVEKEVAHIILRQGGKMILFLARAPIKRIPAALQKFASQEQIVFVTLPDWKNARPTRDRCLERNSLIKRVATTTG